MATFTVRVGPLRLTFSRSIPVGRRGDVSQSVRPKAEGVESRATLVAAKNGPNTPMEGTS